MNFLQFHMARFTTNLHCENGSMPRSRFVMSNRPPIRLLLCLMILCMSAPMFAQDWIRTGTGLGVQKVRIAVPDFKANNSAPQTADLLKTFNSTLFNDLDNAGIFDVASKSFYPLQNPGQPTEVNFSSWSSAPVNAAMLAFGNLGVNGSSLTVQGWLYDLKNVSQPQVLG
jgi:TolB protein